MRSLRLETAGEVVAIETGLPWTGRLLEEAADGTLGSSSTQPTISIKVEAERAPFPTAGFSVLTRGAWSRAGDVVVEDVCGTGLDLRLVVGTDIPKFTFRWRPRLRRRLEGALLPSRFHLLVRAALVQYPVIWWASVQGRAPLHAVACTFGEAVALLAGPGGVGKSTLLKAELEDGGSATSDNLCVGDGRAVWGLVEPMRIEGAGGRNMPHGRAETPLTGRVSQLVPDRIIVVRRGEGDEARLRPCDAETASRSLISGTYMAGELRRFWGFAATLAAGTGVGPSHPPVVEIARSFATRVPCYELDLARRPGSRLAQIVKPMEATA